MAEPRYVGKRGMDAKALSDPFNDPLERRARKIALIVDKDPTLRRMIIEHVDSRTRTLSVLPTRREHPYGEADSTAQDALIRTIAYDLARIEEVISQYEGRPYITMGGEMFRALRIAYEGITKLSISSVKPIDITLIPTDTTDEDREYQNAYRAEEILKAIPAPQLIILLNKADNNPDKLREVARRVAQSMALGGRYDREDYAQAILDNWVHDAPNPNLPNTLGPDVLAKSKGR